MVPTVWLAKVKLAGDKVSEVVAPVPVRLTVWALLLAPSVMNKAPASVPVAEGVNVTESALCARGQRRAATVALGEVAARRDAADAQAGRPTIG